MSKREEAIAKMNGIQVFKCPSRAEDFGRAFWGCKIALQAFLKCCRKVCGKLRRLTTEQEALMEEVKNRLAVLRIQQRAA